jgi:hypothetical protein
MSDVLLMLQAAALPSGGFHCLVLHTWRQLQGSIVGSVEMEACEEK